MSTPDASRAPPWDGLRWEYKHVLLQQPYSGRMDALGEDGWELVSAYPADKKDGLYCVFKRPKFPESQA